MSESSVICFHEVNGRSGRPRPRLQSKKLRCLKGFHLSPQLLRHHGRDWPSSALTILQETRTEISFATTLIVILILLSFAVHVNGSKSISLVFLFLNIKLIYPHSKHMDKHDRPYKCNDPDCAKLPGFTYSGGLLRHQREVHRMHTQGKKLMCPYSDCNRSSGKGFTRQENLKEHIRRLHRSEDIPFTLNNTTLPPLSRTSTSTLIIAGISAPATAPAAANDPRVLPPISLPMHHPSKRKRNSATSSAYVSEDETAPEVRALRDEVSYLRRELEYKGTQIDELQREMRELRRLLQHP